MTKQEVLRFQNFLDEMELNIGLVPNDILTEDTNIQEFITNFINLYKETPAENDFSLVYSGKMLNESNKTYMDILNEYK